MYSLYKKCYIITYKVNYFELFYYTATSLNTNEWFSFSALLTVPIINTNNNADNNKSNVLFIIIFPI